MAAFFSRSFAVAAGLLLAASPAGFAQNPVVENRVPDAIVALGATKAKVTFTDTFALANISGPVVRFDTNLGPIDVGLLSAEAPATVDNFLAYVNRGAYTNTFFHRAVKDFVIQGGGFTFANGTISTIPTLPPVVNEFKVSNTRGTLAMAKTAAGPDSATNQWFFNESDANAAGEARLDTENGGYTVFGRVINNGLATVDAIAALPIDTDNKEPFNAVPVVDYTLGSGKPILQSNVVLVRSIRAIPLVPARAGDPAVLKLKVKTNSNPRLVTSAVLSGKKLVLTLAPGVTGTATLTVLAKDAAKNKVTVPVNVIVQ